MTDSFPPRGRLCIEDSDSLVYDALETIFSIFFIPPEPYPARFARPLPHAGKGDRAAALGCSRKRRT